MTSSNDKQATYKTAWDLLTRLRGSVKAVEIQPQIFSILFYKWASEKIASYINKDEDDGFSYTKLDDKTAEQARKDVTNEIGYFILPSDLFDNIIQKKSDPDFNVIITDAFHRFDESSLNTAAENDFTGLLDNIDFSDIRLGSTVADRNKVIADIFDVFSDENIGKENDQLGDLYEYLTRQFASNSGKSGGEFYTPQEVSTLLARLTAGDKKHVKNVYDPACGSGSLLLRFRKELGPDGVTQGYYGQEINVTTYNLCRMNMIIHGVSYDKFDIKLGDTLINPRHLDDAPFEIIVSNPPYSTRWIGSDDPTLINDERYAPAGTLAPKSKADLAFTMHILSMLSDTGKAAIVEFPGVLYRGGAEEKIRKYLVDNNYIETIIQLPDNMFYGVGISTCIITLSKCKKDNDILFIDASKMYVNVGGKNALSDQNINDITKLTADRTNVPNTAQLIANDKLGGENHYNLGVSTWVEKKDNNKKTDIKALNQRIDDIVKNEQELRNQIADIINQLEA